MTGVNKHWSNHHGYTQKNHKRGHQISPQHETPRLNIAQDRRITVTDENRRL